MPVDQEIPVGGVFVLADAGLDDWSVFQGGEAAGEELARSFYGRGAGDTRLRVGIDARAVTIVGDFEAARFEVGHSIKFILEVEPGGHRGLGESLLAGGDAEENNFLARSEDALAEDAGEYLGKPGAAGKNKGARRDGFARGSCNGAISTPLSGSKMPQESWSNEICG